MSVMSIPDGVGILIKGKLHGLLNRAISNDPDALDQLLRELYQARDELKGDKARADYRVTQLDQQHAAVAAQLAKLNGQVEQLVANAETLQATDPAESQRFNQLAEAVVPRIAPLEAQEQDLRAQHDEAVKVAGALNQGLNLLSGKIQTVDIAIQRAKSRLAQGKHMDDATDALQHLGGLLGQAGSIDNFTQMADERAGIAANRFNDAVGALRDPAQEALDEVDTQSRLDAVRAKVRAQQALPASRNN